MTQSEQKTTDQERAAQAWADVNDVIAKHPNAQKEYRSAVLSANALILTNGLLPTLAFYTSKVGTQRDLKPLPQAYKQLSLHVSQWVMQKRGWGDGDLQSYLRNGTSADVRLATLEALAYVQWLSRFASANIEGN